jgi:mannose-6-phosphate isomerase-like protein (cupin superfamily)
MDKEKKREGQIVAINEAPRCKLQGVDFTALLPREKSEATEVLLCRYPQGLKFPLHQHKECEQFYLILEGKAEVFLGNRTHTVDRNSVVYIPRFTDHSINNVGEGELVYVVLEVYPEGYLPEEPTLDSHMEALRKHYGESES